MKKICSVAIYTGVSKSTTFIERLIGSMTSTGIDIFIFCSENGRPHATSGVKYFTAKGKLHQLLIVIRYTILLLISSPKDKNKLDKFIDSQSGSKFRKRLKYYPVLYHRPDIFHLQWAKGIGDWIWVKDFGMKLIVSLRGAHINYSPIADEELAETYRTHFKNVDAFHAVSEAIKQEAGKYMSSVDKVEVIKSGLNLNEFEYREHLELPSAVLKIVSVGRNHWKKNYVSALDAMAILKTHSLKFDYNIAGIGEDEALMFQRKQLELEEQVNFLPLLPINETKALITSADVLLLPSVEEGIANVVLEAMALGTLVISTDCGGMKEVIQDGKNGFLVPLRDV
ncbi:MAG: glycosyltransferase family 4 protein, partial [Flavobacteriaceae bacterium]|nr:glycosyltransferase family 4 protein [Flavobacteriaceae bacterium]